MQVEQLIPGLSQINTLQRRRVVPLTPNIYCCWCFFFFHFITEMSLLKIARYQRRHRDRDTETGLEERAKQRDLPLKISSNNCSNILMEKNQEKQGIREGIRYFHPVFYLWRKLIVLKNMNMGLRRVGGAHCEESWGRGQERKETSEGCRAELINNHQKGLWELTSCKGFVLGCGSTGRIGAPK